MPIELKVPQVGESITEVEIGEWLKAEGEPVNRDETVVMIDTEKTTVELPSPITGRVTQVLKKAGQSATVGEVIAYMEEGTAASAPAAPTAGAGPTSATTGKTGGDGEKPKSGEPQPEWEKPAKKEGEAPAGLEKKSSAAATQPVTQPAGSSQAGTGDGAGARVMPSAQRVLGEAGISAGTVEGTGPGGRVLKEDALRQVQGRGHEQIGQSREHLIEGHLAVPLPQLSEDASIITPAAPGQADDTEPDEATEQLEEVVPMSLLRRRVAEHLVRAQQTAALLTTFNEIDMSAVMALRKEHQEAFQNRYQIKLGFMSFFVKAVVDALKQIPAINAEIRDSNIVYRNYFDIGVAIGGGKGLVVPVLRRAERMSFAEIELAISDFAKRARDNKLKPDELMGGTFTITNGGIYGSLLSTPIVNPPQSGILGMHAIQERPMAVAGQVVIRPMMYIALTYDHRIVDGREAVTFLVRIKECIENPARMLLEI